MNRRQQKVLKQFLLSILFLAFLYLVVLPWYFGRINSIGNEFIQQSEKSFQDAQNHLKLQQ